MLAARVILFVLAMLTSGCTTPAGELFPRPDRLIVWPASQERPRVRWVGQLSTSADLKPARPAFARLGDAIFGKDESFSMLTPYALCTDGADCLFVSDTNAQVVHVFDLKTRKYARWKPADHEFSQPVGVAYDASRGNLFVSDSVAKTIYVFDNHGKQLRAISSDMLQRPAGLAYDPRSDRLFVADVSAHQVIVLNGDGVPQTRIGSRGAGPGQFNFPTNVTVDSNGTLYVSDSLNCRVQQFDAGLKWVRQIGKGGDGPGYFAQPKGLAVDRDDHLYVVDSHFEAIQIFDQGGQLLLDFGSEGHGPGQFWIPAGIFIDQNNRIYVADAYNRRVQVFDYLPEVHP